MTKRDVSNNSYKEDQYFHGTEADMFAFIQLPKVFFLDPFYKKMSLEAKVVYSAMRDRMSLSIQNGWLDQDNRIYIYFTVAAVIELLCCSNALVSKVMKELEDFCLIRRKKQGLGKPDMIYVLKLQYHDDISADYQDSTEMLNPGEYVKQESPEEQDMNSQAFENQGPGDSKIKSQEIRKSNLQTFKNQISGDLKNKSLEIQKSNLKSFENQISGDSKIKSQEFRKSKSNNTENKDTEYINTEFNKTGGVNIYQDRIPSLSGEGEEREDSLPVKKAPAQDKAGMYSAAIKKNVMYDSIMTYNHILDVKLEMGKIDLEKYDREYRSPDVVDKLIQYMADACAKTGYINIGNESVKTDVVRERFLSMERDTFEDALDKIIPRWRGLDNKKSYCITVLFNS